MSNTKEYLGPLIFKKDFLNYKNSVSYNDR